MDRLKNRISVVRLNEGRFMALVFMTIIFFGGALRVLWICYDTQIVVVYGAGVMIIWSGNKAYQVSGGRSAFSFMKHQGLWPIYLDAELCR